MNRRTPATKWSILLMVCALASLGLAQTAKPKDLWAPFRVFLGAWKGPSSGEPGKGICERSYRLVLNEMYIEVRNKSTWQPTGQNPAGEVHEDVGFLSYDKARKTFVLRQFHIEGFVNQYKLESISADGKRIVFVSEAIENIAPGWRARETYEIRGDNEITETFELAPPDKGFAPYSRTDLQRLSKTGTQD